MGTVVAYSKLDMSKPYIWVGQIGWANSSSIALYSNSNAGIYYGNNFTYGNSNNVTGGTLTGYANWSNFNSYYLTGTIDYEAYGFNASAATAYNYISKGDAAGLQKWVLSGSDSIGGSAYNDYLIGWAGNDVVMGSVAVFQTVALAKKAGSTANVIYESKTGNFWYNEDGDSALVGALLFANAKGIPDTYWMAAGVM
jgi:hypothetical protein